MRRAIALLPVVAVAAGVFFFLPPRALTLPTSEDIPEPVRGVIHVHTRRSDGSGTVDEVAAAAARAGLRFIVLSDHGDAVREPEPPAYHHGVLCIDAIEVTTAGGHLLALGLPGPAPYRLGGDAADVIEDVRRLGGMSIAAHPASAKADLRWADWDLPFDGVEWLNADSEWRDERPTALARALLTYPLRRPETMATLLDRPADLLERWDARLGERQVVAIAAADAHASIAFGGAGNPFGDGSLLAMPGYEQMFRTFSMALPDARLTGDATGDAAIVIEQIRRGRLYSSIDARARPGRLTFTARSGTATAQGGDVLLPQTESVEWLVRTNAPDNARINLLKSGEVAATAEGATLTHQTTAGPGVYRVEVLLEGSRPSEAPWLLSNPIYVGARQKATGGVTAPRVVPTRDAVLYAEGPIPDGTRVETNPKSVGMLDVMRVAENARLQLRYGLGGTAQESPYVALILPAGPDMPAFDRVVFTARADAPMRLWVYFFAPGPDGGRHWRKSVYLDDQPRSVAVRFAELRPLSASEPQETPPLDAVESIRFVVDQVHTPVGRNGQVWIDDIRSQR